MTGGSSGFVVSPPGLSQTMAPLPSPAPEQDLAYPRELLIKELDSGKGGGEEWTGSLGLAAANYYT